MSKGNLSLVKVLVILFGVVTGLFFHYYILTGYMSVGKEVLVILALFLFFVIGYLVGRYGRKGQKEKR